MKKTIIAASGILLSLLLQTTAFHYLAIWGVKPDLLMIWIVLMGLLCGQPSGFAVGAVGGLLVDLLEGRFLGLSLSTGMLVGWLGGQIGKRAFREHWLVPVSAVGFCTLAGEAFYLFLGSSFGMAWPLWQAIYLVILPTAVYNMLLTLIIWPLARKLFFQEPEYVVWRRG
jgi:rod shape-determining protein MreD